jgi:hypothetical protein
VGDTLEVPLRESDWTYLGETNNRAGLSYRERRTDTDGQTFVFKADAPGTYSLRFNRYNYRNDTTENEYVQVIVEEKPAAATARTAPPAPEASTIAPLAGPDEESAAKAESGLVAAAPAPEAIFPTDTLSQARTELEAGRVAEALALLDQIKAAFPSGSDETWWLYGQASEAPGQTRNIRAALDAYNRLLRDYPLSDRYEDARRRVSYLERFYANIR